MKTTSVPGRRLPRTARYAPAMLCLVLLAAAPSVVSGWEAQAVLDSVPTAALVQQGPSWMQTVTTELTAQGALSHSQPLAEGLSLSGTIWGMADSLPSGSPLSTPPAKIDLQSRILEMKLVWEAIPGTLILDAGKKLIHPSSGFFRTPLNVLSHGSLSTADLSGSAVGTWEEGWVGAGATLLVGGFTVSNFFSPRMQWDSETNDVLRYVSLMQADFQDLAQVGVRLGDADVQVLGLLSTGGPGSADPDLHLTAGAGVDTNIGDAVTVRAEVSAADSVERTVVTSAAEPLAAAAQSVAWAPRALVGFTWTNANQLSLMAEYYYNGPGFFGSAYSDLIAYSRALRSAPGTGADLRDQFGTFSAGQHYGFVRVAGPIDDKLSAAAWTTVNLQDFSGLTAVVLTLTNDKWAVNASFMDAWGTGDTEVGLSPLLWKVDVQVSLFL